jgi:hypothetical protein
MKENSKFGKTIVIVLTIPGWIISLFFLIQAFLSMEEVALEYKKVNAIVTDTTNRRYASIYYTIYTIRYLDSANTTTYGDFRPANTEKHNIGDRIEVYYSIKTKDILSPRGFFVKKYLVVELMIFIVLVIPTLLISYYTRGYLLKLLRFRK